MSRELVAILAVPSAAVSCRKNRRKVRQRRRNRARLRRLRAVVRYRNGIPNLFIEEARPSVAA